MRLLLSLLFISIFSISFSQKTQTIRGTIIDNDTKNGLAYVNIHLLNSTEFGTTTDSIGGFEINNIPIGRHFIEISHIGYKTINTPILLNSGMSKYIEISLVLEQNTLNEVTIKVSNFNKKRPINKNATTSARSLSVEETKKYAGSMGDPARMSQNFAGVSNAGDQRNDIVIRGNSPAGLLWRIDGVDVANPNHFGAKGSTGGPVTILNNNLLANSDFFTGSFPAEYGNAFSGVFDLKMKKGNFNEYEKTFQVGWNGIELGIEGPIKKGKSSFVAAYRYADLKFIEKLNLDIGINGAPKYQDLTLKTNFKTEKKGNFSFVFIGGLSALNLNQGTTYNNAYQKDWEIGISNSKLLTFLNHTLKIDEDSSLKSYISFSIDKNTILLDSTRVNNTNFVFSSLDETDNSLSIGTTYRKRFNKKNILDIGTRINKNGIQYIDSLYILTKDDTPIYYHFADSKKNNLWQTSTFAQWKHNFSSKLFTTIGINHSYLYFNKTYSIEPRFGIKYVLKNHSLGFGYGLVSKPLPYITYFTKSITTAKFENEYLEPYKSHQFSISDNWILSSNFRIKIEAYYQYLYDVPVNVNSPYFSLINFGSDFFQDRPNVLVNEGKGKNYGLEFTIEKFLYDNWYFLSTVSLFKSKYQAYDKKWRSTEYDTEYIVNFLGGYEFELKNDYRLQINNKFTFTGGRPLKEFDTTGSVDLNTVYTNRSAPYFRDDIRISLIKNFNHMSCEVSLDLQNVTNHKNEYARIPNSNGYQTTYQMGFLPVMSLRITY